MGILHVFICLYLCRTMLSCRLHRNSVSLTMRFTRVKSIAFLLQIDIFSVTQFITKKCCGALLRNLFPGEVQEGHVKNLYVNPLHSCYFLIFFYFYIQVEFFDGIHIHYCGGLYLAPCQDNGK